MMAVFMALVVLLVGGCDRPAPGPGQGIVSLAPAITETLYALDLGDQVVARSDYDRLPPDVVEKPGVGTALTPNFEAIARLEPALIITDATGHDQVASLQRVGEVVELAWLTLDDVTGSIHRLGEMFDRRQQAQALAARMRTVLGQAAPADAPTVLLALDGADLSQVWYIRRNSLHGRALGAAGGRNAVARDIDGAAVLAPEALLATDPDIIIVMTPRGSQQAARAAAVARFAAMSGLAAVQGGRVGAVAGEGYSTPGPSILRLVADLEAEIDRLWR